MFNKLKDNVTKTKDTRKVPDDGTSLQPIDVVDIDCDAPCCFWSASNDAAGDRNHPDVRSRTSSTGSRCSLNSTTAANADPSAGPALLEWTTDSIQGDSDSASVISSVCPSTAEASVFQARYQKLHRLARGFKDKYQQAMDRFKKVEQERDHLRELLATQQTQAFRRMDELREELALDKKAKQDVDVNYNLMLSEKEEFIQVLRLQVSLLKEGKDLPPELEAKISAGHAREVQRQRSLEQENEELKTEVRTLATQLQLTTTQLEKQTVQRSQLEQALSAHQVKLKQFQAQIEEFGPLKRELTDSKLAQSALEEQVRGLKTQLSSLMVPTAVIACETEVPAQAEPPQASKDLKEPNDAIKLLELQVADLSKTLEETRAHLISSEAVQTQLRSELDDYKKEEPNHRELRKQYEQTVVRLTEMERLLSEKTEEFISGTRALEAMNVREQDLVAKLDDTRARLVGMKSQLDASTLKLAEFEQKETVWKTNEEDYETLRREHSVLVDFNRQLQSRLTSRLQASGLPLDNDETSSLEGLIEQLLGFVSTAAHRLGKATEENAEQVRILTEKHAADVNSLRDSLTTEHSLRDELEQRAKQLQTKIDQTEDQLANIQLNLSEAKSVLSLKEEEIQSLTVKLQEVIERNTELQARFSNAERETEDLTALRQATEVLCKERDELLAKLSTAECERRTEYATLMSQTEEISSALAAANRRLQATVKQYSDVAAEITSLRQQLTAAQSCLQALRSDLKLYEVDSMDTVSGIVFQSIDEVETSCLELMGKFFEEETNTSQKLHSLQARLIAMEDELVHWKRKYSCLEDSLNSQTTVITEFRSSVHNQPDTNAGSSVQPLQTCLDELTFLHQSTDSALLLSRDAQISELKEQLSTLRSTTSLQLQEVVVHVEQAKTQVQQEVRDWDLRCSQACEQINAQHDRLSSLVNLVNASLGRLAKAEHQLELVRVEQHQSVNTSLREELNRTRTDLTELETEKGQLLDELNHTKQQFDALQTQFQDTVQRIDGNATAHATAVLRSRLERLKASSSLIDQVLSDDLPFSKRVTSVEKCFQDLVAQLLLTNQPVWSCDALAYEPIEQQLDELEHAFDRTVLRLDEQKHLTDKEVQRLSLELSSAQGRLHQTTDLLNNAEANTSLCMDRIQKLENELLSEQEQREELRIKLTEVQQSLEAVRKDREESVATIQHQLDTTIQDLATARSSLAERETELSNLAAGTESLKHQLSNVERTYTEMIKQTIALQSHCLRTRTDRAREWLTRNCDKLDLNGPDSLTNQFESIQQLVVDSDTLDFTEPSLVSAVLERFAQAEQWLVDLSTKANQLQSSRHEELIELETLRASERQLVDKCVMLEQRGSELQTELKKLAQTHSELADLQKAVAEKNDLVMFMESELDEFKKKQDVLNSELASKQTEMDQLTTEVSTWKTQFSNLQQQLDQTSGECTELQEKLIETKRTAEEEKHALQQSLEASASVKEGQLKQQLKDLKTRLKQVLQESETLRKSNVSFVNRENEMNSQLKDLEAQLALERHECDNLRNRITQLREQLEAVPVEPEVTVEPQPLVMSSTKPTAHNDPMADFREDLQHATELLKAEHAAHIQEMQCDLSQQLRAREEELRTEFQKTLDLARATETQLRQSHQSEMDAMQRRLSELVNQNHSLQTKLDQLQAEFMTLEQESKLHSLEIPASQPTEQNGELELLRARVAELQTQLSQVEQSTVTDPSYQRTGSPSQTSRTDCLQSNSTRGTEHWSSTEYDPLDPVQLAKPSDWVEQLRSEIMRADSIDSVHPAVRTGHFVHTVSAQDYEALQLHNADLQNQLHQLAADFEALRVRCSSCNGSVEHGSLTIPPYSPVLSPSVGGLHELVEYEYLRNVLFEYMTGRETATLAKVLCSILRFNAEQTKRVLQYEDDKSRTWFIQTKIE
ncbi:golgin subfamily A member 4 [Clonorchis sinensis]|uniref:Golgin subfamily A member 4 n=1 Tax=Clonorchis sinensis TaxID=79923 RepID=G7Y6A7_CLOSI|nr:golgin subfamily A member 4 [Clonorchis sinensis]